MFDSLSVALDSFWVILLKGEATPIALGILFGMILLERVIFFVKKTPNTYWKSDLSNLAMFAVTIVGATLISAVIFGFLYQFFYQFRLVTIPINVVWAWLLIFLVHEFCYYLDHRLAHRIGFFWAFHQVHHGSNHMDITVGIRVSPFTQIVEWSYWLIMPLLGFSIVQFVALKFFVNIWGTFNHTRAVYRMGFLENWLATPANHRVHHGRQPKYLDRNYGQVTMIYDRLFKSFQPEEEDPDFGLLEPIQGYSPIEGHLVGFRWLADKFKSASRWQDKLAYLWYPPGWSHTGDHRTAEILQAEAGLPSQ